MAGRKLRLQIQQSDEHGECRSPRWHGQHAITTNDITGSVTKILITDSKGKRISITIGKNGGIRGVNANTETELGCKTWADPNDPRNKSTLDPDLQCVKEELKEHEEPDKEASILFKEVLDVISEGYNSESLEPSEVEEEFHTVMENIKTEEPNLAGKFETVYINSAMIMPENDENSKPQELGQSSEELSALFNEPTNYTAVRSLLCRLCASQRKDMVDIFGENESYKDIIGKMEYCLPILVRKTDALPNQICRLCLEKLELCHKFRTTVTEVEKQLILLCEKIAAEDLRRAEENNKSYRQRNGEIEETNPGEVLISSSLDVEKLENKDYVDEDIVFVGEAIQAKSVTQRTTGYDIIKCRICGMFFGTPKSCYSHSEIHFSYEYYPCCICNSTFTNKGDSRRHYEDHVANQILERREVMYEKKFHGPAGLRITTIIRSNSTENSAKRDDDDDVEMLCAEEAVDGQTSTTEQSDDQDIIRCRICGLYFGTGRSCYAHSEIHYSYNNFPCSMCDKTFSNREDSEKHSIGHTGRKAPQRRKELFEKQMSRYQPRTILINGSNSTEKAAEIEIEGGVDNRTSTQQCGYYDIIKCRICGLYFGTSKSCYIHSEIHATENDYPCSMCDKTFANKLDSRRHSYEHTVRNIEQRKSMMYKKPNIRYNLRSASITGNDTSSNSVEKIADKDKADEESFSGQETVSDQSSTDHSGEQDMIKCRVCGLYFGTAKSCYLHSRIHASENHFPCSMCDKILTNEKESCKHSEEHHVFETRKKIIAVWNKKVYIKRSRFDPIIESDRLPNSPEEVAQKDDDIHRNDETVQDQNTAEQTDENDMIRCRICGMEFENAEDCFLHSSVHSGRNYFPCSMCHRIFGTERIAYKHHLNHVTNTGNEGNPWTHVCDLCGEKFMTEDRLEFHKIHHNRGTKTGFCEKCDKVFSSESALYSHMILVHKEHRKHEEHMEHQEHKKFRTDICSQKLQISDFDMV